MSAPAVFVAALINIKELYGDRAWQRYGFVDAFHPTNGWTNPDVIGIDQGMSLLAAEIARTGSVWRWFMANPRLAEMLRSL
jgi:hypothetical protein